MPSFSQDVTCRLLLWKLGFAFCASKRKGWWCRLQCWNQNNKNCKRNFNDSGVISIKAKCSPFFLRWCAWNCVTIVFFIVFIIIAGAALVRWLVSIFGSRISHVGAFFVRCTCTRIIADAWVHRTPTHTRLASILLFAAAMCLRTFWWLFRWLFVWFHHCLVFSHRNRSLLKWKWISMRAQKFPWNVLFSYRILALWSDQWCFLPVWILILIIVKRVFNVQHGIVDFNGHLFINKYNFFSQINQ